MKNYLSSEPAKNAKVNGGGGIWGGAHGGVDAFLEEEGIKVFDSVAGISFGSVSALIEAASVDPRTRTLRPGTAAYERNQLLQLRTLNDLFMKERGEKRLDIHRLLSQGGGGDHFKQMMRDGIQVPLTIQVARKEGKRWQGGVMKHFDPGEKLDTIIPWVRASAANEKMFGIQPEEIDGDSFRDDIKTSYESTEPLVKEMRKEADKILATRLSFMDTAGLGTMFRPVLWHFRPDLADTADLSLEPKRHSGPVNGFNCKTNWGLGPVWNPQKIAWEEEQITSGKRIPLAKAMEAFMEEGYKAAKQSGGKLIKIFGQA